MITILRYFFSFIHSIFSLLSPHSFKQSFHNLIDWVRNSFTQLLVGISDLKKKASNLIQTNIELGLYHFYKGNNDDAYFRFRLIKMSTSSVDSLAYYNLGRCLFVSKKLQKAKKHLLNAIKLKENYPEASYYLKKIDGPTNIKNIPLNIVEEKFDFMSLYYVEDVIINNQYQGYKIALHEVIDYMHNQGNNSTILDVGCGTGVCGHFLKINNVGCNITGLDISSHMLKVAENCYVKNEQVYNELLHLSAEKYFNNYKPHEKYDVILAIDSLGSERDLYNTLSSYKEALKLNGVIIAIVRLAKKQSVELDLDQDLFYYSQDHMLEVSSKLDMEVIKVIKCQLYSDIDGCLCVLAKK